MITHLLFTVMAMVAVPSFGTNPGALDMFEYAPSSLPAGRPVVVVLHGCTQTAAAMETAGWNTLADEYGFLVVYAQQRAANQQLGCFTWYASADTSRGQGEAASIVAMVDHAIATHASDPGRVYVTGLSAGGAFTSVMLGAYPDRFAAGSVMAGLPFRCASSIGEASACQQMTTAAQKTPKQWGDLVRTASSHGGPWPRVQIWQGTADYTVAPANATEIVDQWTDVWQTDQTADATDALGMTTRTRFVTGGKVAVELFAVKGMGHAIATGDDALGACPATSGAYFSNQSICSTRHAAVFFGLAPAAPGDPMPPDDDDDDDPPIDDDGGLAGGGGCSTSGDASSLLLALLVVFSARRAGRGRPSASAT
jgi:poly(hydroxyalkanoate) depolymerase family esterase